MILPALIAFLLAALALAWVEHRVLAHLSVSRSALAWNQWWSERLLLPLLRTLCLLLLIGLAYPALFGLEDAPRLGDLLGRGSRWTHWLNWAFLAGVALPALLGGSLFVALSLPLQSVFAVALLYRWYAMDTGTPLHLLPSPTLALTLGAFSAMAILASQICSQLLRDESAQQDLRDLLLLCLQAPLVLIYAQALGAMGRA